MSRVPSDRECMHGSHTMSSGERVGVRPMQRFF